MKACIVTANEYLFLINKMINQNNVYIQAIITNDRIFAVDRGCPKNMTFAYWQFSEVIQQMQPDYIFMLTLPQITDFLTRELKKINFPTQKLIYMTGYFFDDGIELYGRLKHLEKNPTKYQMFITGISYTYYGIVESLLNLPTINFSQPSQDLYYDYEIAKKLIPPPPVKNNFKYALIGLAPYSLHYDLSMTVGTMNRYFLALNDFHNATYNYEMMKKILKSEYQTEIESRGKNYNRRQSFHQNRISFQNAIDARKDIDSWNDKYYPKTFEENKQILENYLSLLDLHKIKSILFLPPMIKEYCLQFNKKILNELFEFIRGLYSQHNFAFINGWAIDGFDERDFYDVTHMNLHGAQKFTKILNDVIMQLERNNL